MNDALSKSGPGQHEKRNLNTLFPQLKGYFSPRIIGEVNNVYVKITRVKGDDVPWHIHDHEDELFYIVKGSRVMEIDNEASFDLNQGDLYIVRRGVQHRVFSEEECWILLIEQKSTKHTGEVKSDITRSIEEQF